MQRTTNNNKFYLYTKQKQFDIIIVRISPEQSFECVGNYDNLNMNTKQMV